MELEKTLFFEKNLKTSEKFNIHSRKQQQTDCFSIVNWYSKVIVNLILNRVNITITFYSNIFFSLWISFDLNENTTNRGKKKREVKAITMMGISLSVNLYNPFHWASPPSTCIYICKGCAVSNNDRNKRSMRASSSNVVWSEWNWVVGVRRKLKISIKRNTI